MHPSKMQWDKKHSCSSTTHKITQMGIFNPSTWPTLLPTGVGQHPATNVLRICGDPPACLCAIFCHLHILQPVCPPPTGMRDGLSEEEQRPHQCVGRGMRWSPTGISLSRLIVTFDWGACSNVPSYPEEIFSTVESMFFCLLTIKVRVHQSLTFFSCLFFSSFFFQTLEK